MAGIILKKLRTDNLDPKRKEWIENYAKTGSKSGDLKDLKEHTLQYWPVDRAQGYVGSQGVQGDQGVQGVQGVIGDKGIQGVIGSMPMMSESSFEDAVLAVLEKYGIYVPDISIGYSQETSKSFTLDEVIKIIDSMNTEVMDNNLGSIWNQPHLIAYIDKDELIEKFKTT